MRAKLEQIMTNVTTETLEKLAFMFAFPDDDPKDRPTDSMTVGSVSFKGPFSGTLSMAISTEALRELAANMLGLDEGEEPEEEQMSDALKETMNVVCGNLLPAVAGDETVFDIGVPTVLADGSGEKEGEGIPKGEPSATAHLDLDEGFCTVSLFFDGKIPDNLVLP